MSDHDTIPPSSPSPSGELEVFAGIVRKVVREEQSSIKVTLARVADSVQTLRASQRDLEERVSAVERGRVLGPIVLATAALGATATNTALLIWMLMGGRP